MRCGKVKRMYISSSSGSSQPARMRCGKSVLAAGAACAVKVATRTNALWQSHRNPRMWGCLQSRNPHECAVAKLATATITNRRKCRNPHECAVAKSDAILRQVADRQRRNPHECAVAKAGSYMYYSPVSVATRTNALWQSEAHCLFFGGQSVATRTNALWQRNVLPSSSASSIVATRTNALWQRSVEIGVCSENHSRNPHECAEAKPISARQFDSKPESQPARMR